MSTSVKTIGKLRVGGDWACAHGDFAGLRHVAQQLVALAPEPLLRALHELVATCHANPERAAELWRHLKPQLAWRAMT
jgi:hypothetical protein